MLLESARVVSAQRSQFTGTDKQLMALLFVIPVWLIWIYVDWGELLVGPSLALIFVAIIGVLLVGKVARSIAEPRLMFLGWIYLIQLTGLIYLVLYHWGPYLEYTSGTWGYDPQRYYDAAIRLVENSFQADAGQSLSNVGIVYYYAIVMYLFGENPLSPALINGLLNLTSCLLLLTVAIKINLDSRVPLILMAVLLLMPETLWYTVMTSREPLVIPSLIISVLGIGAFLTGYMRSTISKWWLVAVVPALLLLGAIRPIMLITGISSIGLIALVVAPPNKRWGATFLLLILLMPLALSIPSVTKQLASSTFAYTSYLARSVGNYGELSHVWTESSMGRLLIPNNFLESLLYIPVRGLVHLIAPLPNLSVDWNRLLLLQALAHLSSAMVYVVLIPRSLAGLLFAVWNRACRSDLLFHIPLWMTLVAVAWGQPYIHERYRVMVVPFLLVTFFLYKGPRSLLFITHMLWYGTMALAVLGYTLYKFWWVYI